ncbi:hypothetical protein NDS46_30210 (plasmid) [Paenibacillus thiaminolyticus]|uniref:hypothetical protein n=1 Tax=Paenibacillus thiaminolyticus TaxID=49283 RepID=UPI0023307349|nr:hypothetical protein [Paenibacillus thiaminolyticus]WCF11622.1 hypothetical protein NDS46_30210 [Paenibacillus thiaminolyticus]
MGSIYRVNAIKRFIQAFHRQFEEHFSYLVGMTIAELKDVTVDYHVRGNVLLSNGEEYPLHYRWSGEDETCYGEQLDEDFILFEDYFKKHFKGKRIISVRLSHTDRDDEVYLLAYVAENMAVEIPVGYDPETNEITNIAKKILNEAVITITK